MPPRVDACPHCGRHTESNEEFCTTCGAWLYGGSEWPAPPQAIPVPETGPPDPHADPVPLTLPDTTGPGSAGVALRLGILALTVAAGGTWFLAERMIVDRDDRLNWDIAWIAAAAIAIVGGCWIVFDAYRRGQTRGWDQAWRVWEPPATS